MKLKILNKGYSDILNEIGAILKQRTMSKEIEDIFEHYLEIVNGDEVPAAILTLTEIIRGQIEEEKEEDEPTS